MVKTVDNSEFETTDLEPIPVDWNVYLLGDVCEIVMGQSPDGNTYIDEPTPLSLPLLNGTAEFGIRFPTPVQYRESITKMAEPKVPPQKCIFIKTI